MPLDALTEDEIHVLHVCLQCVAAGNVVPHDEEFETIMGIDILSLRQVLRDWPHVDDKEERVWLASNNSLNNLVGYPHDFQDDWGSHIPISRAEVVRVCSPSGEVPCRISIGIWRLTARNNCGRTATNRMDQPYKLLILEAGDGDRTRDVQLGKLGVD
jgi:hypothetical protein